MTPLMRKQIQKFANKSSGSIIPTDEDAVKFLKSLAENYPDFLAEEISKIYDKAVAHFDGYGSFNDKLWEEESSLADSILALLDIETDYPGLYPAFQITRNGKTLHEYSVLNAIRQYNNFWNHW
jgi:hypothetical protein